MSDLNYPFDKEFVRTSGNKGTGGTPDARLFRPRPHDGGSRADNRILVLAFPFRAFQWFRDWPQTNYFLKLWLHRVVTFTNGSPRGQFVICPVATNNYARNVLSDAQRQFTPPPFPNVRHCPLCAVSDRYWRQYRQAKKDSGIVNVSLEHFKSMMDERPEIRQIRDHAIAWGPIEKYYFQVFDYSKYAGEVPLGDGETGIRIQGYLGPRVLADSLYAKQVARHRFWDIGSPDGRVVIYSRDTTRGVRYCKYTVEIEATSPELDSDTRAYLTNIPLEDFVDPTLFATEMSAEEMQYHIDTYFEQENVDMRDDIDVTPESKSVPDVPKMPVTVTVPPPPPPPPPPPSSPSPASSTTVRAHANPSTVRPMVAPKPVSPSDGDRTDIRRTRVSWRKLEE